MYGPNNGGHSNHIKLWLQIVPITTRDNINMNNPSLQVCELTNINSCVDKWKP